MLSADILISSTNHPANDSLDNWISSEKKYSLNKFHNVNELRGGDILFLVSCNEIIKDHIRKKYKKALVIHASDLPEGKGWSPYIWEILNGSECLTLTLFEATDKLDAGDVWKKSKIKIPKYYLSNEILDELVREEINLMKFALDNFSSVKPSKQKKLKNPKYFKKRTPEDSELDINDSIKKSFNLMRVADFERYPSFFIMHGKKFYIKLTRED